MNGAAVAQQIRKRIQNLEAEHAALTKTCTSLESDLAATRREREQLIERLSKLYLPQLDPKSIGLLRGQLPELHDRVETILEEKRRETARLDAAIEENRTQRARLDTEIDDLAQQLEAKAEERDRLEDQLDARLDADLAYAEGILQTKQARERLLQSQRRLEAAETERDEKLPDYEADSFFSYLRERKFGSPEYAHGGMTARLDGWVAALTGFTEQWQSYRLLSETPELLAKAVATSEEDLQKHANRVDAMKAAAENEIGLTRTIDEGEALFESRTSRLDQIAKTDGTFRALETERAEMEDTRGGYYRQALDEYQRFFQKEDLASLREVAGSTETRADDGIASMLEGVDQKAQKTESNLASQMLRRRQLADQMNELLTFDQEFHRKNYDASNSTFETSLDIDSVLTAILTGAATVEKALRLLGKSHRFLRSTRTRKSETVADILWTVAEIGVEVARASGRHGGWSIGGGGWGGSSGRSKSSSGRSGRSSRQSRRSAGRSSQSSGGGFRGFGGGKSRTTGGFG